MRSEQLLAFTLLTLAARVAPAQLASSEYRPQLQIGSPFWHGVNASLVLEHRYDARSHQRTEVTQGLAFATRGVRGASAVLELRRIRRIDGSIEHRFIPGVIVAAELGHGLRLRERARVEVRDVAGTWSRRWQGRTVLERPVLAAGRALVPGAFLDLSYDTRFSALNRRQIGGSVRVPLAGGTSVEPYVMHQRDDRRDPVGLVVGGMIVRVAL